MGKKSPANPEMLPATRYLLVLRTLRAGRMLVKGWLAAEWGVSENNRKARFYRLTAEGRKQLAKETDEFDRLVYSIQQVMRTV